MLLETGCIVAVETDAVWIESIQKSTCGTCVAKKGCGQSLLSKVGVKPTYIRVLVPLSSDKSYSVGQVVTIGIPDDVVVRGSLLIYLVPLLLMIVFSGVAHTYMASELLAIGAGLIGLVMGGLVVRYHAYRSRNNIDMHPVLVEDHLFRNQQQEVEVK